MSFDNNFIDELKLKVNIVDVIGRDVALKKAGSNYKGLCPFHSEKTPSFIVNEERQIFNCFGCGEKGDVITYTEKYYRLPFLEAVEKLCKDNGIKMPEGNSNSPRINYEKYYSINAAAAKFFYKQLTSGPNKAYSYCKRRELKDGTITKFGLGYAPAGGNSLCKYLIKEGFEANDIIKLGLGKEGKNGLYDYFRDRLMFPIFNTTDKVIGFGGRVLGDSVPKYLNSQESDIFLKKNNLFALNYAKNSIQELDRAIIVEGYMDAISLHQSGITNVAASLGTALTDNQARLLTRYSNNVVLSYDSDNAGINATLRGIEVLTKAGAKVRVLQVNDGKDPDEYIKQHGKDAFEKLIKEAMPATDFRLQTKMKGYDLNDDLQVLEYIRSIVPILRSLSPVEQEIYINKLAEKFNLSERAIALEVQTENSASPKPVSSLKVKQSNAIKNDNRNIRIEMSLLLLVMNNTRYIKRIEDDCIDFASTIGIKLFEAEKLLADTAENGTHRIEKRDLFLKLDPEEESFVKRYMDIIKLGPDDEAFYNECKSNYLYNNLTLKQLELRNKLSVAEKTGNKEEVCKLAKDIMDVSNEINNLSNVR